MNLLDRWLPEYQFREYHSLAVSAPEAALWEALKKVTPEEVGPLGWLMAMRSLPARLAGRKGRLFAKATPILDVAVNSNFLLLEEQAPAEIVLGGAGQYWKLDGGPHVGIKSPEEFAAFHEAGYLRAVVGFRIGAGQISTETRVQALDDVARRKFAVYWALIRPGSGWIRMAWLRAIGQRALSVH